MKLNKITLYMIGAVIVIVILFAGYKLRHKILGTTQRVTPVTNTSMQNATPSTQPLTQNNAGGLSNKSTSNQQMDQDMQTIQSSMNTLQQDQNTASQDTSSQDNPQP